MGSLWSACGPECVRACAHVRVCLFQSPAWLSANIFASLKRRPEACTHSASRCICVCWFLFPSLSLWVSVQWCVTRLGV